MNCNSCNSCNTCPSSPCQTTCKTQITAADLGTLIYLSGLDINLCPKYQAIIDVLGLEDCEGNPIGAGTQIVICEEFQTQLCETLTALAAGDPIESGTVLIGDDCLTHAMPAFQAPLSVTDTSTIDLTLAGTVLSGVVEVSVTAGNIIEVLPDGLYADVCSGIVDLSAGDPIVAGTLLVGVDCETHSMPSFQAPISVTGTNCIDLTFAANVLSASPVISPTAGNSLTCNANGLYTPDLCEQLADVGGIVLPAETGDIFVTNECIPRTLPVNGGITVLDTLTVDMTLSGAGVLSGDVEVSSVPDNILTVRPDGLAVRCTDVLTCIPDVVITAVDTNCLDLTVTEAPTNTFTITGSPVVSVTAGNQLSCTANGLYVGATSAITCEAIQDVFVDNPAVISPGQRILVDDCESYLAPSYNAFDTTSINTTIGADGFGNPVFSSVVILDPAYPTYAAGSNTLNIGVSGLSAPPLYPGAVFEGTSPADVYDAPVIAAQVFTSPIFTINVSNPSAYRQAILTFMIGTPVFNYIGSNPTGGDKLNVTLHSNPTLPSLTGVFDVVNATVRTFDDTSDFWEGTFNARPIVIQPGEVGTIGVSLTFEMETGSLANLNIDRFIVRVSVVAI